MNKSNFREIPLGDPVPDATNNDEKLEIVNHDVEQEQAKGGSPSGTFNYYLCFASQKESGKIDPYDRFFKEYDPNKFPDRK